MATNFLTITPTWISKDLTDQGTQYNGLFCISSCNVIREVIQRFITGNSFEVRQDRSPLIGEKHTKLCKESLGSIIIYDSTKSAIVTGGYPSREREICGTIKKTYKLPIYTTLNLNILFKEKKLKPKKKHPWPLTGFEYIETKEKIIIISDRKKVNGGKS